MSAEMLEMLKMRINGLFKTQKKFTEYAGFEYGDWTQISNGFKKMTPETKGKVEQALQKRFKELKAAGVAPISFSECPGTIKTGKK